MTFPELEKKYKTIRTKALKDVKESVKGRTIRFNDLTLRDGHQSLFATRMSGKQIARVVDDIASCGFYDLEVWGGATLDVAMRYLDENPFERLGMITKASKGKSLSRALCRGVNLFGYQPYPDDIIRDFSSAAIGRGLDLMRIFDALNDPDNLKVPVKAVKDAGGLVDAAVSYTTGPVFDTAYWTAISKIYQDLGADILSVKDMAGLANPQAAWELIPALKEALDIPVHWHSHCTPGYGHLTAVIAMLLGADAIDTCFMPFAGGSSHPSIELMHFFAGLLGIHDGIDTSSFEKLDSELRVIRSELCEFDKFQQYVGKPFRVSPELEKQADDVIVALALGDLDLALVIMQKIEADLNFPAPDLHVRDAQVPGGMFTNMLSQLETFGMLDRLRDVLDEIPVVREAAGFVPLVTPTSQIVGVQAVNNVKFGRWNNNITDYVRLVRGEFGRTPVPIDPKFREKITGSAQEVRYDPSSFDYSLPGTSEFMPDELYPDREHELCYYLFPKVAGGESGFLARRALERRERKAQEEAEERLSRVREQARFKLSSRNTRIAALSEAESEALHEVLVREVQGWDS
jgi:pyruvate/oxaloacetate carboxyltransferase